MRKYIAILAAVSLVSAICMWQKNVYDHKFDVLSDTVEESRLDTARLRSLAEDQKTSIQKLMEDNKALTARNEGLENDLMSLKYDMLRNNLPGYWNSLWKRICEKEGKLTDKQIVDINILLQSVFAYDERYEVNPLSCFFTSFYDDVRDINLTDFLRYFPYGEVPENLQEFDELSQAEHWPFEDVALENIPVPVHRYEREVVQDIFTTYACVDLDELSGVGLEGIIYLESTDAYYNFTSDFGPGTFECTDGIVEDEEIRLYGKSYNGSKVVLVISASTDNYYIEAFYKE